MNVPLPGFRAQPLSASATRRSVLKGAGALGLTALTGTAGLPWRAQAAVAGPPGLYFPLTRSPFENNGASPWYADVAVGTAGQSLKINFDSGAQFNWVTSSLCAGNGNLCQHQGGTQFLYQKSPTYSWVDTTTKTVSFGPWGSMTVSTGHDLVAIPGGRLPTGMYLAENYTGDQFSQLVWDGGIGLPSGTAYADPSVSFFVGDLMNAGLIDPEFPYLAFDTDAGTRIGSCRIGGFDPAAFDPASGIFMPWKSYLSGLEYIWTGAFEHFVVGETEVARDGYFCLDSGSSQFKGDPAIMNRTLGLIQQAAAKPTVHMVLGETGGGERGHLRIPPEVYMTLIEGGPQMGQLLPQFNPMDGLDGLILVGSVLMDHCYTVFEYDVAGSPGHYQLSPRGMYLFNKTGGGPKIIQAGGKPFKLEAKKVGGTAK